MSIQKENTDIEVWDEKPRAGAATPALALILSVFENHPQHQALGLW